jgi:membrane-bound lytic murein transglycosylase D
MQDVISINRMLVSLLFFLSATFPLRSEAATPSAFPRPQRKVISRTANHRVTTFDDIPNFDLPVIYNGRVKAWITYFQTDGKKWFTKWLERSSAYLPVMKSVLRERGMPQDLAYVAMIESGFSAHATSTAAAVGYWQFIESTANRYGLKTNWWLDERRDFAKSTLAASKYLADLYRIFRSWYLTASAYNMGEGRLQRLVKKYNTNNYWILAKKPDFPRETSDYIPKLIAAMLIAKAPRLYGIHINQPKEPYMFDYFHVPGGTDLMSLAEAIGTSTDALQTLNPELIKGFVPPYVKSHRIRIPKGYSLRVSKFIREQL